MSQCDIVIPVWNQLEATRDCINSIERNTLYPHRLIIIDNASGNKTAKYMDDLQKDRKTKVLLLRNKENQGFIKAVNKGVLQATAEYVCILNNDTFVTDGWLKEMINIINEDPAIGIVNPSSNTLGQRLQKGMTPEEYAEKSKSQSGWRTFREPVQDRTGSDGARYQGEDVGSSRDSDRDAEGSDQYKACHGFHPGILW